MPCCLFAICYLRKHLEDFSVLPLCMRLLYLTNVIHRVTQKKRELLKTPTKIEEIQEKNLLTETEPLKLAF